MVGFGLTIVTQVPRVGEQSEGGKIGDSSPRSQSKGRVLFHPPVQVRRPAERAAVLDRYPGGSHWERISKSSHSFF